MILNISYQRACNTSTILPASDVIGTADITTFLTSLREEEPLFYNFSVPEQGTVLEHGELPAAIFSGIYTTRSASGLANWNGILTLDIDADKDRKYTNDISYFQTITDEIIELLRDVNDNGRYFSPFGWCRSKSGKGLRVMYHFDTNYHLYTDVAHYYRELYHAIGAVIDLLLLRQGITELAVDYQAGDISHSFAIVQDDQADVTGATVDNYYLKRFLSSYQQQKATAIAKNTGKINSVIDTEDFKAKVSVVDFSPKPGISFDNYTSRYQLANVLSFLYGEAGRAKYLDLIKRDTSVDKYRPTEFNGYYDFGITSAKNPTAKYFDIISANTSVLVNNEVKRVYTYAGQDRLSDEFYRVNDALAKLAPIRPVLHIDTYLTEREKVIARAIKVFKRVVIKSETGTGKTTLMKQLVQHFPDTRIDFIAPTLSIVQQQDIMQVTGNKKLTEAQTYAPMVATTYASINKLAMRDAGVLVVDEAHHLLDDYTEDFREANIKDIKHSFSRYQYVILCTGTAHNLDLDGFKLIAVEKNVIEPLTLVEGVELDNFMLQPADLKTIYVTNKATGEELFKHAVAKLGYKRSEVAFLNAETKADPAYLSIIKQQVLPTTTKLLITTKLLCDGVNINNEYATVNVLFYPSRKDALSFNEVKQYSARFRKATNIQLNISAFRSAEIKQVSAPSWDSLVRLADDQNAVMRSGKLVVPSYFNKHEDKTNIKRLRKMLEYIYFNEHTEQHEVSEVQYQRQQQLRLNTLFRNSVDARTKVLAELNIVRVVVAGVKATYDTDKLINCEATNSNKAKRDAERANFPTLLIFDGLVTDRFQNQLLRQYYEMTRNGFSAYSAQQIIMNSTTEETNNMVVTSRLFYNRKKLEHHVKPRIGDKLTVGDCALLSFYCKVNKYIEKNNLTTFKPKDAGLIATIGKLAAAENKRFSTALPTKMTPDAILSMMKVMYEVERDEVMVNSKREYFYYIVRPYTLAEFQETAPVAKSISLF